MKPIDIIIATYNRRKLLQQTIEGIEQRTKASFRLIVVDNCSDADDTVRYLQQIKKEGRLKVLILNDKNIGAAGAFNKGFAYVESDLFITTDDDIVPPELEPCWLEQLVELFNKNYPEYGAISLRHARTIGVSFNRSTILHFPDNELGEAKASCPWLRIQKRSDVEKLPKLFGSRMKYNSTYFRRVMERQGFRCGYTKDIWANHIGYAASNKGYPEGFTEYARYSEARLRNVKRKPYPEIDPKTHVPIHYIKKHNKTP